MIAGSPFEVAVRQIGLSEHPRLEVTVAGQHLIPETRAIVARSLAPVLGLRTNLQPIYKPRRRTDTFPGDDVGARNRLASWLGRRDGPLDYDGVKRAVRRWHPYAGPVYFHLLLAGLAESGEMRRDAAAA